MSDEAKDFVRQQPLKAQQKIAYNIRKLECGIMDKELFKKLESSDIWELRTQKEIERAEAIRKEYFNNKN